MSVPGLLIALMMSLIALWLVGRPLWRGTRGAGPAESSLELQRDRLRDYYSRVLTNIRDLDEDFATGKIESGSYQVEREVWVGRGIRLLRVQDELDAEHSLTRAGSDAERIDRAIEAAVSAYREDRQPHFHSLPSEKAD